MDKASPDPFERAARVLEARNRAFRVLYDTVLEVEGAPEDRIHAILCRNLRRIADAEAAGLCSYDPQTEVLTLEAVDILDRTASPPLPFGKRPVMRLSRAVAGEIRDGQIRQCTRSEQCAVKRLCAVGGIDVPRQGGQTVYCLSCVFENDVIAVGTLRFAPGTKLRMKDMVDTYLGLVAMVLQRVNAARALRESEDKYRNVVERASDGIAIICDGIVEYANPRLAQIVGRRAEELPGSELAEHVYPGAPWPELDPGPGGGAAGPPVALETALRHRDGRSIDVEVNVGPLSRSGRVATLVIVRDVTERKRTEARMRAQADLLRAKNVQLEAQRQQLQANQHELVGVNRALQEATTAATAANEAKSQFLANMSHEIRTPMTAILGFAETLRDEHLGCGECSAHARCTKREETLAAVDIIRRNGSFLLELINDILDLSKIEAGGLVTEQIACSPFEVLENVRTVIGERAQDRGLTLRMIEDTLIPETIISDPMRLRQVLVNLLGNAVKFTEEGTVTLHTRLCEDGDTGTTLLEFEIVDTGIGMNADEVARLFQPFTQADASTTRRYGGTGLGLNISKRLVESLGGQISVRSHPGLGSTFTFCVPTGSLRGVRLVDRETARAAAGQPAAKAPGGAAGERLCCRVLLAEDGPDNQRLITHFLSKAGVAVTVVPDGQQAVDAVLAAQAAGEPFDVVLMDMQMPVLDGYRAARRLREQGCTVRIVALTAHAMTEDREKCLAAGCDAFASKPINREKLLAVVRGQLSPAASIAGD
ncbi:MAG: ATP-binding protein [Phycisphaerae bacterium]|jgi:PAS domain S-box-containing protein